MVLAEILDRFVEGTPISVMLRAALENVLSAERVDELFQRNTVHQHQSPLLFSIIVNLMGLVVCRSRKSVHDAYQAEKLAVSVSALYGKLRKVDAEVSRALVRETAVRMREIMAHTGGAQPPWLPGYRVLIADGNHQPASEHRLKELRNRNVAPLPGHAVAVLDPSLQLVVDAFVCLDGHASERTLLPQLLSILEPDDVLIADRNFCTTSFLRSIIERGSFFVIRQHASSLKWEPIGAVTKLGRCDTGQVSEQAIQLLGEGQPLPIRRITIDLKQPTRNGAHEIHMLTNLPAKVVARLIADLYRKRWTLESAFQELEANLQSELTTLAYPGAVMFAFCLSLVCYNLLSLVKSTVRTAHADDPLCDQLSNYYLASEIACTSGGMLVVLPEEFWAETFAKQTPREIARFLLRCAKQVRLAAFRKHPRGPKKKRPAGALKKRSGHISTQHLLDARRNTKSRQRPK